jgi:hypothetical protein
LVPSSVSYLLSWNFSINYDDLLSGIRLTAVTVPTSVEYRKRVAGNAWWRLTSNSRLTPTTPRLRPTLQKPPKPYNNWRHGRWLVKRSRSRIKW